MRRVNQFTVVPEQGEILSFEDAFGVPFGEPLSQWTHFGTRTSPEKNPVEVCISLGKLTKTEVKALLSGYSAMNFPLRDMVMSTKQYANYGDPENVAEKHYGYKMGGDPLVFFVNDKDENPAGVQYTMKWGYENGDRVMVKVPVDAGVWLNPVNEYYLTYRRVGNDITFGQKRNTPLSIYYVGTNDPENGGEVNLDVTKLEGEFRAEEITMGNRSGLIIWDE